MEWASFRLNGDLRFDVDGQGLVIANMADGSTAQTLTQTFCDRVLLPAGMFDPCLRGGDLAAGFLLG
jgi:hypothetical protein